MKTLLLFSTICLLTLCSFSQIKVNYTVYHSNNLEKDGLKVVLNYSSKKAQDSMYLHYSNNVWGETDLFNCLEILQNENPLMQFKMVPDSNRIVVHYPKSKSITFSYRIHQDFIGDSLELTNRPRMNNSYFHVLGEELFVVPEDIFHTENRIIEAKIAWIDFPANFTVHNTFASQKTVQLVKGELHSTLFHSLFVGGDYRYYQFMCKNKPVVFAIRGNWYADYSNDSLLLKDLEKTIFTQREFWNDYSQNYYTVIMTPTVSQNDSLYKGQSTTGSGLKNGFMIQSSNNPFNSMEVMKYMFNHELMHQWIGLTIRNAHEELNYWFSEGFTDYYTYKNRLRNGDISLEEWKSSFNKEVIAAHYKNPERNTPNYKIKDDFWKSRDVEKIPYRRGAIFAFWLDNKIMLANNNTKSLDDLMRILLAKCTSENTFLTDELFLVEARKFIANEDISYEFQKYILVGEDIPLTTEDLIDCFGIELKDGIPEINLKVGEHSYIAK